MTATTATAARFTAVRAEGRYRVQDTLTGEYVAVLASKAKAADKAAALNAEAYGAALEAAPTAEEAAAAQAHATRQADSARAVKGDHAAPEAPAAPLEVVTLDGEELSVEVTATPAPDTKAYRIGKVLREFVLGRITPADDALVAQIAAKNVCYDGTATLRLTFADAATLSGWAKNCEEEARAEGGRAAAPKIMAAVSAQKSLVRLFA